MVGLKPTCDEAFRSDAFNRTHANARRRNPQPNFNVEHRSGPGIWDQRGSWSVSRFVVLDGADDEEDTTEDRCGAEGKDRLGGAARAVECCGPSPAIRGASEPDLRLEEAASGAGGAGVRLWCRARC